MQYPLVNCEWHRKNDWGTIRRSKWGIHQTVKVKPKTSWCLFLEHRIDWWNLLHRILWRTEE